MSKRVHGSPLTERMFFALSPELKSKAMASAQKIGLDLPAFTRAALAIAAEQGLSFGGPKNSPVSTGQEGG